MNDPIETIERDGLVAKIYVDEDAESPDSWTNVGALAYRVRGHAGYLADTLPHPDYELTPDAAPDHVFILPVRAWDDRNGTELRIADSWDEANGWIYATTESIAETIGDQATESEIRAALESELGEWQKWAQGDVYGVVVEDAAGEQVDSCWGFYGYEYAEQEAERMLADSIQTEAERDARRGEAVESDERREADRRLGADIRAMYREWMEDANEEGIISGSAADQCADLYDVLTKNGLVVR